MRSVSSLSLCLLSVSLLLEIKPREGRGWALLCSAASFVPRTVPDTERALNKDFEMKGWHDLTDRLCCEVLQLKRSHCGDQEPGWDRGCPSAVGGAQSVDSHGLTGEAKRAPGPLSALSQFRCVCPQPGVSTRGLRCAETATVPVDELCTPRISPQGILDVWGAVMILCVNVAGP